MPMPCHMTIEGAKQGEMAAGCGTIQGREDTILVEAVNHEVKIPTDPQTGDSRGKRVHSPLRIVKFQDKSTPMLFSACCNGEKINTLVLQWYRIAADGQEELYFTTTVEDARIVSVRTFMPNALDPQTESYGHMEELSVVYRMITWTHDVEGTTNTDDWNVA